MDASQETDGYACTKILHEARFDNVAALCRCSAAYDHPHGAQDHELHSAALLQVRVLSHMQMSDMQHKQAHHLSQPSL